MSADYETVIGLEVHAQLLDALEDVLRLRRRRSAREPNTQTCPVCLGMPGIAAGASTAARSSSAIRTALALGCRIEPS